MTNRNTDFLEKLRSRVTEQNDLFNRSNDERRRQMEFQRQGDTLIALGGLLAMLAAHRDCQTVNVQTGHLDSVLDAVEKANVPSSS